MSSLERTHATNTTIQAFFRAINERIRELAWSDSTEYDFVCECDNVSCMRLLQMRTDEYDVLDSDGMDFVVLPGHERTGGDKVIVRTDRFVIVSGHRLLQ